MSKRLGIVALVLIVMASCAGVSAQEQSNVVNGNGYQVQPAHDEGMTPMSIQTIYSTITQDTYNSSVTAREIFDTNDQLQNDHLSDHGSVAAKEAVDDNTVYISTWAC
ncbi:MAG TPA: hypothetical protein PKM50_07140 [Methanoregula sp.]|nr:hypothetical protein [Methanoregula sp.]